MSTTIWKFELVGDRCWISLPLGATVLTVQVQHGSPFVWALVDPEETALEARLFITYGTGHPVPDEMTGAYYIGTFQQLQGSLIWHVFEKVSS